MLIGVLIKKYLLAQFGHASKNIFSAKRTNSPRRVS